MTRTDLKPYCFEVVTKDKTYYISCKNDEEVYSWMDEIYNVSVLYCGLNREIQSLTRLFCLY